MISGNNRNCPFSLICPHKDHNDYDDMAQIICLSLILKTKSSVFQRSEVRNGQLMCKHLKRKKVQFTCNRARANQSGILQSPIQKWLLDAAI